MWQFQELQSKGDLFVSKKRLQWLHKLFSVWRILWHHRRIRIVLRSELRMADGAMVLQKWRGVKITCKQVLNQLRRRALEAWRVHSAFRQQLRQMLQTALQFRVHAVLKHAIRQWKSSKKLRLHDCLALLSTWRDHTAYCRC